MLYASIVVSGLLLLLAAGAYFRESRGARGAGGVFFGLRVGAILLLFLILSGITVRHYWTRPGRVIAVLTDVSQSMSLVGADSLARRALGHMTGLSNAEFRRYAFAETTLPVRRDSFAEAPEKGIEGTRTRLGAALATVARTGPGAILLLSDGRDNGRTDPVREAARHGIPVYAVGCGPEQVANLALTEFRFPDEIHTGETARVRVRAHWSGPGPASAAVELEGRSRSLRFDAAGTQDAEFELVFTEPGFRRLTARADSIPGEITAADNRLETAVRVRPGRVRVLYMTDAPGPSARFIGRALERIDRVETVREIAATPGGPGAPGAAEVYILDRMQAGPDWPGWSRIADAVRAGAGVLVIDERGFDDRHPLARFIPGGTVALRGAVQAQAAAGGPLAESGRTLERLPPLEPAAALARPEEFDAWLLSATDDRVLTGSRALGRGRAAYFGLPVWRWGFMPGGIAGAPDALELLLEPAVRYLAAGTDELLRLVPTRSAYLYGDEVRLELGATTPDGRPLTGAAPVLTLRAGAERSLNHRDTRAYGPGSPAQSAGRKGERPFPLEDARAEARGAENGTDRTRPEDRPRMPEEESRGYGQELFFPMVEIGDGRYRVDMTGLEPGDYEAVVDMESGEVRTGFVVAERSREEQFLGLDDRLLREIALRTGGMYFRHDSLPGPGFEPELRPSRHGFSFTPRRSVWAYLLLVLLAGTEWALRRRKGLQ